MKLNKKQFSIYLFAVLASLPMAALADEAGDTAAARNNTQAQKMTMSMGEVNVNARTGDVDFQAKLPQFGGLDMSINYSNLFGFAAMAGNPSFLGMPQGMFITGVPFVHVGNDGSKVLFFNGSDYYIDSKYSTIDVAGRESKSGIRYMTSKMMRFHDYTATPTAIYIESKSGGEVAIPYSYSLEYKTGYHLLLQ